jgi:hypothetical protein
MFIHECNSACACGPDCRNRVLQHGLSLPVEVFYAGDKGWGVRINQAVKAGTFIIECVSFPLSGCLRVAPGAAAPAAAHGGVTTAWMLARHVGS